MRRSPFRPPSIRIALALALVCAASAGPVRAQFTTAAPPQRQMPNVVGLSSDQAIGRLRQIGLSVQTREVASTQPRGTVTAQSPAAGAGIKTGQGATLDVSTGPSRDQTGGQTTDGGRTGGGVDVRAGQVPDLTGMSRNTAQLRLVLSGLVLGSVDSAWVEGARGGRVVAQDPRPGTQVVRGGRVNVTLASRTPPGATRDTQRTVPRDTQRTTPRDTQRTVDLVAVPDLSGLTADRARVAVGRSRLLLGSVDSAAARSAAAGTVVGQNPAAGERVRPGSFVTITVAQVPRVTMPSLIGQPVAEARRTLAAAGLRAGAVTERDARGAGGRVLTQSIPAGTRVRPGMTVDLAVSRVPVVVRPDTPVAAQRDTPVRAAQQDTPVRTAQQDTQPRAPAVDSVAPVVEPGVVAPPAIEPFQPPAVDSVAATPPRPPTSRPGGPALLGIPREVLWGIVALLVLAVGAILYRLTRRGVRPPVQAPAAVPPPVSPAVRLSVAGGEWESATQADAAGPVQGGKLRLNMRMAEPAPLAEPVGAALGAMRVVVRVMDDAGDAAVRMDDSAPVLAGAAVQVRVRDGGPELTVDEDTDILGRRA